MVFLYFFGEEIQRTAAKSKKRDNKIELPVLAEEKN